MKHLLWYVNWKIIWEKVKNCFLINKGVCIWQQYLFTVDGFSLNRVLFFCFLFQELEEIRKNGLKCFRNVQVDESDMKQWQGLILPVSIEL